MRRSIIIPDDTYRKLKQIAYKKGVSIAIIIRMACKEYADKWKRRNEKDE